MPDRDNRLDVPFDLHERVIVRYQGRHVVGEIIDIDDSRVMAGTAGAAKVRLESTFMWVPLSRMEKTPTASRN